MGKYFVMSTRFNKQKASDFGLAELEDSSKAICLDDNSVWVRHPLFDFGWGRENGYYKLPLPNYEELIQIILSSNQNDDIYGAAAIILDQYADELLSTCEQLVQSSTGLQDFQILSSVFRLQLGVNQSKITGKTFKEIEHDSERWRALIKYTKQKKKFLGFLK